MSQPKLVRDRIPEIIRQDGREPVVRQVQGAELLDALLEKLNEESDEFTHAVGSQRVEELADMLEVVRGIAGYLGVSFEELLSVANEKARERGGFSEGVFLESW